MVDVTPTPEAPVTQKQLANMLQTLHSVLEIRFLNLSEALAIEKHGLETVAAAAKAAGDKLGSFIDHHHPYDSLVKAFKAGKL